MSPRSGERAVAAVEISGCSAYLSAGDGAFERGGPGRACLFAFRAALRRARARGGLILALGHHAVEDRPGDDDPAPNMQRRDLSPANSRIDPSLDRGRASRPPPSVNNRAFPISHVLQTAALPMSECKTVKSRLDPPQGIDAYSAYIVIEKCRGMGARGPKPRHPDELKSRPVSIRLKPAVWARLEEERKKAEPERTLLKKSRRGFGSRSILKRKWKSASGVSLTTRSC